MIGPKEAVDWAQQIADAMTTAGIVKAGECCGVITVMAESPRHRPIGCSLNYDETLKRWLVELDMVTVTPATEGEPS